MFNFIKNIFNIRSRKPTMVCVELAKTPKTVCIKTGGIALCTDDIALSDRIYQSILAERGPVVNSFHAANI